jgi:hypothetical protein
MLKVFAFLGLLALLALLAALSLADMLMGWLTAGLLASSAPLGANLIMLIATLTGGIERPGLREALIPVARRWPIIWAVGLPLLVALLAGRWSGQAASVTTFNAPWAVAARLLVVLAGWSLVCWRGSRLTGFLAALSILFYGVSYWIIGPDLQILLRPDWAPQSIAMQFAVWQFLAGASAALLAGGPDSPAARDLTAAASGGVVAALYFAFISYFVVWYADVPDKTEWYVVRLQPEWIWMAWLGAGLAGLALASAVVSRPTWVAWCCLAGLAVYVVWWLTPSEGPMAVLASASALAFLTLVLAAGQASQRRRHPV